MNQTTATETTATADVIDAPSTPASAAPPSIQTVQTMGPIAPHSTGQLFLQAAKASRLADVQVESGVHVVQILVGKERVSAPKEGSWAAALESLPRLAKSGSVIAIVQNDTETTRPISGTFTFTDEEDEPAAAGAAPDAPSPSGTRRIVNGAMNLEPKVMRVGKSDASVAWRNRAKGGVQTAARATEPTTPPTTLVVHADAAADGDGPEVHVALLRAHGEELVRMLRHGMILTAATASAIAWQFAAPPRTAPASPNEVLLSLRADDAHRLSGAFGQRTMPLDMTFSVGDGPALKARLLAEVQRAVRDEGVVSQTIPARQVIVAEASL